MNIAEKLIQIAESEQKVYEAGKTKGYSTGYEKGMADASKIIINPIQAECAIDGCSPYPKENIIDLPFSSWLYAGDDLGGVYTVYGYPIENLVEGKTLILSGATLGGTFASNPNENIFFVTGFNSSGEGVGIINHSDIEVTTGANSKEYYITVPEGLNVDGVYFSCLTEEAPPTLQTEAIRDAYAQGYNDGIEQGYAEGVASVDNYLLYTSAIKFNDYNLFGKKEVVLDIPLVTSYSTAFQQGVLNTTVEHLTINGSSAPISSVARAFYSATTETTLKRLTLNCNFSEVRTFNLMLNNLEALEVIDGTPIDFSGASTIGNIHQCSSGSALREIRVAPSTIKVNIGFGDDSNLSKESIQSIVGGLDGTVSEKTLTLSQTAVNNAFGSTESAEWLELIATKSNWTISLQ